MRTFAVLAPLILLNACALPAAFTIASLAADGISYVTSGKSVTDHALSVVANEDCAMWRALQARPICRDRDAPATLVAAAPAPGESEVLAVVLATAPAADGSMAPEIDLSKVPATVIGVAPAAGGSMAPETAKTETHADND
ncbi:MAG: hypothetical protein O7D31_07990 [Alphaproteobacteria bacterium]|nr:hypothetical protein [Alphaproteobacteria bacterium]